MFTLAFRPKLIESMKGYGRADLRNDLLAALNVCILAFPLSIAFAIASGGTPEQGLFTAILGGGLIAAFGGSRVQIGGPTGAFVVITYSILLQFGADGLLVCTALAGLMLCLMGMARMGSAIRFIPYPVSRALTNGIAVLILAAQIKHFLGLRVGDLPVDFASKVEMLALNWQKIHPPTLLLALASLAIMLFWPRRFADKVPGSIVGLVLATSAVGLFGLHERFQIATIASEFGPMGGGLPPFRFPSLNLALLPDMIQPAFTIALLVAMQALLCGVVTDGMLDDRHDSNQELLGQGIANFIGPFFGCIPVTGAVARSIANVRAGARSPVAGIAHALLLLLVFLIAGPLLAHIPLATLSAILVAVAAQMISWDQFKRLARWPLSDSSVFVATLVLTVFADLTVAVEAGVVLAALLMVKRVSETSQITAVDETTETEGSQHSLIGRTIPEGVQVFRVFGAFFFGVVDKLADELKRAKQEPDVLILRVRKVLAMDATGLQALEDLHARLSSKGKQLILSAPHTQPLMVMEKAGFLDRLGRENVCPHVEAALERAREILAAKNQPSLHPGGRIAQEAPGPGSPPIPASVVGTPERGSSRT